MFGREVPARADRAPVAGIDRLNRNRAADDPADLHVAVGQAKAKTPDELDLIRAKVDRNKGDQMSERHSGTTDNGEAGHKSEPEITSEATEFAAPKLWRARDLEPAKQPRWLARKWVPRAAPTVLCGDEGIGESLWVIRLIAAVTTEKPLLDIGLPERDPAHVVIGAITEEDWATMVAPRLAVAGADIDMVSVVCSTRTGPVRQSIPKTSTCSAKLTRNLG